MAVDTGEQIKATTIPGSFPTPNRLVDELMPLLSAEEYKLLSSAVRDILGYDEKRVNRRGRISVSRFMKISGLSKDAVREGLKTLTECKVLEAIGDPTEDGQEWQLNWSADHGVDFACLKLRFEERIHRNRKRTTKARVAADAKRRVLSDSTPKSDNKVDCGTVQPCTVGQTDGVLSDSRNQSNLQSNLQSNIFANDEANASGSPLFGPEPKMESAKTQTRNDYAICAEYFPGLPFKFTTCWPATNSLTYGKTHIIVGEDFKLGRLGRKKGESLCKCNNSRLTLGIDHGKPTCAECLKIATSIFEKLNVVDHSLEIKEAMAHICYGSKNALKLHEDVINKCLTKLSKLGPVTIESERLYWQNWKKLDWRYKKNQQHPTTRQVVDTWIQYAVEDAQELESTATQSTGKGEFGNVRTDRPKDYSAPKGWG